MRLLVALLLTSPAALASPDITVVPTYVTDGSTVGLVKTRVMGHPGTIVCHAEWPLVHGVDMTCYKIVSKAEDGRILLISFRTPPVPLESDL